MSLFSELLGGAGTALITQQGIEQARKLPQQLSTASQDIASRVGTAAQFKPYTVTAGGATTQFDPTSMTQTLGEEQQALVAGLQGLAQTGLGGVTSPVQGLGTLGQDAFSQAGALLGQDTGAFASGLGGLYAGMGEQQITGATSPSDLAMLRSQFAQQATGQQAGSLGGMTGAIQQQAMGMLGQATPTAQGVYEQIRAMQTPEEERQRMALENRLAAQGRLGVTTSAFGGTPEQLALEKAQAEARNMASLQAMQTADQLASSQQQRAAQMAQLGMSAEQIEDQLQSSALQRGLSSGQLAGQLAQTGAGIEAQQQQLGQGLLGLGLQAQQLGGQLGMQDIQRASALTGLGSQVEMLQPALEQQRLANAITALQASGIPQQQALQMLQPALTSMGMAQRPADLEAQAIANLGQQELQGIPAAINAEALLRQAQLEGLTNMLGLQRNEDGDFVDSALRGLLGDAGEKVGGWISDLFD